MKVVLLEQMKTFITLLVVCVVIQGVQRYQKARCLDGSQAAIYLHKANPKRIMIYFMGGGACQGNSYSQTLENCYERSLVQLGSSLYWPQTMTGQGILSTDPSLNFMADWSKIFVIYCDGAIHQGQSRQPYQFKGTKLYFRGAVITRSVFDFAHKQFDLRVTEKMVLTGSSAGGIATFIWADYLAQLLGSDTQFYPVPDSSIFLDPRMPGMPFEINHLFLNGFESTYAIWNRDQGPPNTNCAQYFALQPWNCFSIQAALSFLKSESLFIQSSYDSEVIFSNMQIKCLREGSTSHSAFSLEKCKTEEMVAIEGYRAYFMRYADQILKRGHNIWSISCSWHAGAFLNVFYESPLQRVPMGNGTSMQAAVYSFVMKKEKVVQMDTVPWPNNSPCSV